MIYTLHSDYGATGEGRTLMVLVGTFSTKLEAIKEFTRIYGEYYAIGLEVAEGINFNFPDANLLVSTALEESFNAWMEPVARPYFRWHSELHYNFS